MINGGFQIMVLIIVVVWACLMNVNSEVMVMSRLHHFNVIIYADDTRLCSTMKINADATHLNMEQNNVSQWIHLNKLSLNVNKP